MKDLLTRIAQALVDKPEKVQVDEIKGSQTVVLELRVADTDIGRIIGKQGSIANAIRAILKAASGKGRKNSCSRLLTDVLNQILQSLLATMCQFCNILDSLG